jgi:hypothetical protein
VLPAVDTDLKKRHFNVIIREIKFENISKPKTAVPVVYWRGSPVLKNADFQLLYMLAHERTVQDYVEFSVHTDFNSWFAV